MPALTGGSYHHGEMHMKPPSLPQFPANPKLDYFRHDLVEGWLAGYDTLPISYTHIRNYINRATTTLMGPNQAQYIWTFKSSPTQSTKYAIELWTTAVYNVGES